MLTLVTMLEEATGELVAMLVEKTLVEDTPEETALVLAVLLVLAALLVLRALLELDAMLEEATLELADTEVVPTEEVKLEEVEDADVEVVELTELLDEVVQLLVAFESA